jgi:hypothetical protein
MVNPTSFRKMCTVVQGRYKMKSKSSIRKELFDELEMGQTEKEILELTKLSDDDLYNMIGVAARETSTTLKPSSDYLSSPNIGDTTGKSAFFYSNPKVTSISPSLYFELPEDSLEAGRVVYGQIEGHLDRVICETITNNPLYGYKQEAIKLGAHCVEEISRKFPKIDGRIVNAFVALRAKQQFNFCTKW